MVWIGGLRESHWRAYFITSAIESSFGNRQSFGSGSWRH